MLKIKDFEDYTIDKNGNVFSIRKNKYLKQTINKYGYCKVTLQKNNYKKMFSVHRLVAQAYLKDYSDNLQVNHINGIKTDNRLENLEMVTPKENMQKLLWNYIKKLKEQLEESEKARKEAIGKAIEHLNKYESIKAYYEYIDEDGYDEYNYDENFKKELLDILKEGIDIYE